MKKMPKRDVLGNSKSTNAQAVSKSRRSTYQLRKSLEARINKANERLEKLKQAGYGESQFYQTHKKGFKMPRSGNPSRQELSKSLAEVNRFLSSKSSTVRGMKQARKEQLERLSTSPNVSGLVNEKNLDKFNKFMQYYRDHVQSQTKLPSDFVANDLFGMSERLKINPQDLLDNIEDVTQFYHVLQDMSLEDMFPDGKIDKRRRFKVQDYLDTIM